jgi:AcrR family transcriptional regulator
VETRQHLYRTAITLIAGRGYEATTLRDIAKQAQVSVGLLYRYFPSKRAVVLTLYDDLSAEFEERAATMKPGPWRARFLFALTTSVAVLSTQRDTMGALMPILIGDPDQGLFAPAMAFSRRRVQGVFEKAVREAADAPSADDAAALGRLLYLLHLALILWWLLDKSPKQKATQELIALLKQALPIVSLLLRLQPAWTFVRAADKLCRDGLVGDDGNLAPDGEA